MGLYCGIDLHSNNHVVTVIDEADRRLYEKRHPNEQLALVIALEIGDIGRFPSAGDFASYCRLVDSKKTSNHKKKGEGNRKNGNPYLAWAFMEAAQFALRYLPEAKRFYERKRRQRHMLLAKTALAHKLARACYRMLREEVPFERERLFAA